MAAAQGGALRPPPMAGSRDIWLERRALMEQLLRALARCGTQILFPLGPGSTFSSPSLLDQLNPDLIVQQLKQGPSLDLSRCLFDGVAATDRGPGPGPGPSPGPGPGSSNPFAPPPPPRPQTSAPGPFSAPPVPAQPSRTTLSYSVPATAASLSSFSSAAPAALAPAPPAAAAAAGLPPVLHYQFDGFLRAVQNGATSGGGTGPLPGSAPEVQLRIRELKTGLDEREVQDLAFTLFLTCIQGDRTAADLSQLMQQQLEVGPAAAAAMSWVLLQHQEGSWSMSQRTSLEGVLLLMARMRPLDFERAVQGAVQGGAKGAVQSAAAVEAEGQLPPAFSSFHRWHKYQAAVLRSGFEMNVEDGWTTADPRLGKKLLARLRGCLRRMDCSTPEDLEEDDYAEAVQVLSGTAKQLAGSCRAGWQLPWGVRVRVCEVLLAALFDPEDQVSAVGQASALSAALELRVWPALHIGPVLQLGMSAWVHFKQYIRTRDNRLLRQLKYLMSKVLTQVEAVPEPSDHFGLGLDVVGTDSNRTDAARDHLLAADVARCIVDHSTQRLGDYYAAFMDGGSMQGLLDVLMFASKSRGDDEVQLSRLLVSLVRQSTAQELRRRQALLGGGATEESVLLGVLEAGEQLHQQQLRPGSHTLAVEEHLPGATLVADAVLYDVVGREIMPWLSEVSSLDPSTLMVLTAVISLDQMLGDRLEEAAAAAASSGPGPAPGLYPRVCTPGNARGPAVPPAVPELMCFKRWPLQDLLRPVLERWAGSRAQELREWSGRALGLEKWAPLSREPSAQRGYAQLAVEVFKMIDDALDALFALGLPLHREVLEVLLRGADACLSRCGSSISSHMGSVSRLLPPRPPPTRFKKDLVAKQERTELAVLAGKPVPSGGSGLKLLSKLGSKKSKSDKQGPPEPLILDCVPKVSSSPDHVNISQTLTPVVLSTLIQSAHHMRDNTEGLAAAVAGRWQAHAVHATGLPPDAPPTFPDGTDCTAWVQGLLEPSRAVLDNAVAHGCTFLATKVTFWDLRQEWLEQLYRHHVSNTRIDHVLELTNVALGDVCSRMPPLLQSRMALELLRSSAAALEFVLLDGGPCRWYIPSDVPLLEQDLGKLGALFHAQGEGLPRDVVDKELKRLYDVLRPMALEVGPLMDLVKEARERGTCSLQWRGQVLQFQEQLVLRVLARRPDRTGSKLLKEKYKMSKKIK